MRVIAYTRGDADALEEFKRRVQHTAFTRSVDSIHYFSDGLSGHVGFVNALRKSATADFFVVDCLADLGRDMAELLDNLNLFASGRPQLFVIDGGFSIDSRLTAFASALRSALVTHGDRNRAIGFATARATGATIGRPKKFAFEDVRKVVDGIAAGRDRGGYTIREVARALGCGVATASRYLKELEQEREGKR